MNIFIVENSLCVRASLQSVLSDMSEVKVVGQAANEADAKNRIGALLPDVVILSLGLQCSSGIGVLEHVKKGYADIKVIVFAHYTDAPFIERCGRAGADHIFDSASQLMQLREVLRRWRHTSRREDPAHGCRQQGSL
jgi:DNA-binding NarL/FixJ family response regulator